jgi:predicted Rossmann fold flavoprotein
VPDIIVIGGGAAGLLAAGTAKDYGGDVIFFEKNKRVARKVLITGKGRCNLTNNTNLQGLISSVANGGRFLYSAFSQFSAEDTMALFEGLGVPLMTERGNRVFPKSERAVDIVDALQRYTKNVTRVETEVEDIVIENNCVKGVLLKNGETVLCKKVIVLYSFFSIKAVSFAIVCHQ